MPLAGQSTDEADVWSESIVVSASRFEQEQGDVAANATILGEVEIERSAALTPDDFLRQVPGFSLFRRSSSLVAHPTSQGVSLRGIGPSGVSRTLVLLDGVPLNDPFGGWVYWSRVALETVERAEVVRGGTSNVWGNFALGGVVHLISRDPADGRFSLRLEGGNKSTASETWVERSLGPSCSRGEPELVRDGRLRDRAPRISVATSTCPPSRSTSTGACATSSTPPSRRASRCVATSSTRTRGNGTPLTGNDTRTDAYSLVLQHVDGGGGEWNARLFGQTQDFSSTFSAQEEDRSAESPALDQFLVDSEALGLGVQWTRSFGDQTGHVVTAGGEWRATEGGTNEDFFWNGESFNFRRKAGGQQELGGIFVQDTLTPGDRWQVQVGARVDRWSSSTGSARSARSRPARPASTRSTTTAPRPRSHRGSPRSTARATTSWCVPRSTSRSGRRRSTSSTGRFVCGATSRPRTRC